MASDLNNLNDISRDKRYFDICGITQSEMKDMLYPYIQAFAQANNCKEEKVRKDFRRMYDGYRFTSTKQQNIYNPFSVFSALDKGEYGNYWFETGTPNYIVELLKRNNYILSDLTTKPIDSTALDSKDDNGQSIKLDGQRVGLSVEMRLLPKQVVRKIVNRVVRKIDEKVVRREVG